MVSYCKHSFWHTKALPNNPSQRTRIGALWSSHKGPKAPTTLPRVASQNLPNPHPGPPQTPIQKQTPIQDLPSPEPPNPHQSAKNLPISWTTTKPICKKSAIPCPTLNPTSKPSAKNLQPDTKAQSAKNLQNTLCFADFLQIFCRSGLPNWSAEAAQICKKSAKHSVFCRFFAELG